jgi:hypothetical protein
MASAVGQRSVLPRAMSQVCRSLLCGGKRTLFPTEAGTRQGDVISPTWPEELLLLIEPVSVEHRTRFFALHRPPPDGSTRSP